MMIGNEDGVVEIPGRESRTCAEIQEIADSGAISDAQCEELQPLVQEPCECVEFICDLCGGGVSTDPGGIIDIPGEDQGLTTCAAAFTVAQRGGFNQTFCPTVQEIADEPCGCERDSRKPSRSPTESPEPTGEPTRRPTRSPTPPPTSGVSTKQTALVWIALVGAFNMIW